MESGLVRVTAAVDPQRTGSGYPVLVQLTCLPSKASAVAKALAARPDVRFLAHVTGPFDLVAELIVGSSRDLARVLIDDIAPMSGVTRTTTESVLRNFKTSYDWGQDVLGARVSRDGGGAAPPAGTYTLDDVDSTILALLRKDGRRSYQKIGSEVGLGESAVRRRVESLLASRSLTFPTLVDANFLGYDMELFMWLQVDLNRLEAIAAALAERVEVRYLSATSGYSDLVAEVILRSQPDLYHFRTEVLGGLKGIHHVDIALELRTVKRAYLQFDTGPAGAGTNEE